MINPQSVEQVDHWLDAKVGVAYAGHPLAQHWARVAKITEEQGEAIAELILWTGQNPRKGQDPEALERLLNELADTALTAVYALQHFTKNTDVTEEFLRIAQERHVSRVQPLDTPTPHE
jgi:hypothetical protein